MKKTTYALLAAALLTSPVVANEGGPSSPTTCAHFSGFTAGVLLGYGSGKGKTTYTTTTAAAVAGAPAVVANPAYFDIGMNGMNGGVILGYQKTVGSSKVNLGLEASYILSASTGKSVTPGGHNIVLKRQDSFDLNARVGLVLANALPYVGIGWANSKLKGTNYGVSFLSGRVNGMNFLVGADMKATSRIIVGLGYTYTVFPNKGNGQLTSLNGTTAISTANNAVLKTKITDNKFQLKMTYLF